MSKEYDDYLKQHISGVQKAGQWLEDNLPEVIEKLTVDERSAFKKGLILHDLSKTGPEEYKPYNDYFYGKKTNEVKEAFDYAWLHHIHRNPHHWQYWCLIQDDDGTKCLEMPKHYALEMICDWWSFSWKSGNLYEIFDWYDKHKNIQLHDNTREYVRDILDKIKLKLDETK